MPKDPQLLAHQQWLGYLQPVGLAVSPPALVQAQAFVNSNVAAEQTRFLEHVKEVKAGGDEPIPAITDLKGLLTDPALFAWKDSDLIGDEAKVRDLEVVLIDYHETLRPSFAVPAPEGGWLLLVQELPLAADALAGHPAGPLRAPLARIEGAHRSSVQRRRRAAGVRSRRT